MMFTIKIVLFLLSCIPFVQPRLIRKPWSFSRTGNSDNCICYPAAVEVDEKTVNKLIDPENNGVERLVLYIYRVKGDKNIQIFTPNVDKQLAIPDLPLAEHDELRAVTSEPIVDIFDLSPHKITLQPKSNEETVIGFNPGLVSIDYSYNSNEDYADHKSNIYNANKNDYKNEEMLPNSLPVTVDHEINPNDQETTASPIISSEQTNTGPIFSTWFDLQLKRFQKVASPNDITAIRTKAFQHLVHNILTQYGMRLTPVGTIIDNAGDNIDLENLELRPFFVGSKISYHNVLHNSHNTVPIPKTAAYIEGILVMYKNPPQILGLIPLGKISLDKYENKNRRPIQTANDGNMNYNNMRRAGNNEGGNTKVISVFNNLHSIPSIHHFLPFSNKHGPIISDKTQNLISTHYKFSQKKQNLQPATTSQIKSNDDILLLPSPSVTTGGPRNYLNHRKKKQYIQSSPYRKKESDETGARTYGNYILDKIADVGEVIERADAKEEKSKMQSMFGMPIVKNLLKKLIDLLVSRTLTRRVSDSLDITNLTSIVDEASVEVESSTKSSEEGPGIRIIGGNAATGSGIPLNNKGRSSYVEDNFWNRYPFHL